MGKGCVHLDKYKEIEGTKTYEIIHTNFVVCASAESRESKALNARCHVCKRIGPVLHACLLCVFFGCHKHIREHGKRHDISMELTYGQVYCSQCHDYVYDTDIDKAAFDSKMKAGVCRKRLFQWTSWEPDKHEKELITFKSKVVCIAPESTIGLRGLLNLGNTCFMNCIVQALMHTPLLRDYFMTERHKCEGVLGACLVCELAKLFQEFYTEARVPLTLHHLLHLIWTHATHLAGSKQQDAHEFFIATLDVLHTHFTVVMNPSERALANDSMSCPCIIHQIFTGGLQSDLVCQNCKGISTTVDPIWDLSLELSPATIEGRPPSSLVDCLERYTTAEHLGPNVQIMCKHCHSLQQSTKRLTMQTLPIVVSFHLKRFQHSKGMEKISTQISFPEMLDMAPFMSRPETPKAIPSDYRYSLFAVINHLGNSEGGHYTAYVRQQRDYWYKCDDHVITRANLKEVLDSEGYLLFYHKHVLEYE